MGAQSAEKLHTAGIVHLTEQNFDHEAVAKQTTLLTHSAVSGMLVAILSEMLLSK